MTGDTENTREAAKSMTDTDLEELRRELQFEGAYHVVVEGGYHQETLTDEEADFLSMLLINKGVAGLVAYADAEVVARENNARRNIANINPLINASSDAFEELISRLDDGNSYPGFFLQYNEDTESYTLYEEGYDA